MSISAVNAVGLYNFPTATGQIVASRSGSGDDSRVLRGTGTATLDGSATTFTLNFVDGTVALPFTPSAVNVFRVGGNAAASVFPVSSGSITTTGCVVTLAAAGTNTNTVIFGFEVWK